MLYFLPKLPVPISRSFSIQCLGNSRKCWKMPRRYPIITPKNAAHSPSAAWRSAAAAPRAAISSITTGGM